MPDETKPSPDVHLNLNVRGLKPSATVALNERSNELRRQGRTIYKLGLGQSPFPVPRPVVEALRTHAAEKDYQPVKGLWPLREAVAAHHRRTFGIECSPENVIIGPGSKELMFLLQLVYYGDILIPTPAWVSYAPQAGIIGRHVRFLPTRAEDGWNLTAAALDNVCKSDPTRPRILILNYPSNPTGGTYNQSELEALAEVARRYKVVVLSDEIYARLHHVDEHHSILPIYPEGTIFSGGLSKWCGAGGWRLGVFIVPDGMRWLLDAMAAVASETFTSTSAPIQYAAIPAFLGGPEIELYLERCRGILRGLGLALTEKLRARAVEVLQPKGGFYLFPDFSRHAEALATRGITTSHELCDRLLDETGVAILPGVEFGRPPEELTARLAYVDFDGTKALELLAASDDGTIDDAFLQAACKPTLDAVDRICEWLTG